MSGLNDEGVALPGGVAGLRQSGHHRSHSAPPGEHLDMMRNLAPGGDSISGGADAVDYNMRTSLQYYQYYHSMKPVDPRLPPPLYNWSAHSDTHNKGLSLEEGDEEDELHKNFAGIASSVLQNDDAPSHDSEVTGGWEKSLLNRIEDDFPRSGSPLYDSAGGNRHGQGSSRIKETGSSPKSLGSMLSSQAHAMHAFNTAGMQQNARGMMNMAPMMSQQYKMRGDMYGEEDHGGGADDYDGGLSLQMQQLRLQYLQIQQQQQQQQGKVFHQNKMLHGMGDMSGMQGINGMNGAESMEQQLWALQQQQQQQGYSGMGMHNKQMEAGLLQNLAAMQQGMKGMPIGMNPAMLNQLQGMGLGMQDMGHHNGMQGKGDGNRMGARGQNMGNGNERGRDRGDRGRGNMHGERGGAEVKRSTLLEEFRASKLRNFELRDILEHCDEFCRDQHGSRFIQTKLEIAPPSETELVFQALLPTALSLMTDLFGNYVVQKFLERGTQEQISALAKTMRGRVLQLSLDMYGCRVVQKAVEVVDGEEQTHLVNELQGHVMKCVRDQNGNHVIQKCIERSAPATIQFIVDDFVGQVVPLATHPYGCRVIQRILEYCGHSQVINVLNEIVQSTRDLVFDQYGNYVVQHVLEHGQQDDRTNILLCVRGNLVAMSQHKFASNVVEKLLQFSSPETRPVLLEEFTGEIGGQPSILVMMRDAYGNYVIQKALDVCQGADRERLISCIKEHLVAVRRFVYGKHIIAHIEKLESGYGYKPDGREGRNCRIQGPPHRDAGGFSPHRDRGGFSQGGDRRRDVGPGMHSQGQPYFPSHVQ